MKKILSVVGMGIISMSFLFGCATSKNVKAEDTPIFTYMGTTSTRGSSSYLYKFVDEKEGKIIYVIESTSNGAGRAMAVVDK